MIVNFTNSNLLNDILSAIEDAKILVSKAESGETWDEVNDPLDKIGLDIGLIFGVASHLNSVKYNEDDSKEYEKVLPIISRFFDDLGTNKPLYDAFKSLENTELNAEQKYILSEGLKGFELGGIHLSNRGKKLLSSINERLSVLQNDFGKNTMMSTNEWTKDVSEEDLAGISKTNLDKFQTESGLQINLQIPSYMEIMTNADSQELRQEVYMAYITRASEIGITDVNFNNKSIMDEIIKLRFEKANLLGFDTYADLSVYSKMVESPNDVVVFLDDLVKLAMPQAKEELNELQDFATLRLNPWDLTYYANKLKEHKFSYKKEEITDYFPESKVMEGLFDLIHNLYGVSIKEIIEESYHSDVKVLELRENGDFIGKIYLDPYSRENKRGGAWMDDYVGLDADNKPIAFVVCNFNKATSGNTHYEFGEIVTLFHEFGHALHHILTKCKYPGVAGINGVPWDGVELPSQYMENFCYEQDILTTMSQHRETKDELPKELFNKLIASKNFQSGMGMLRQCNFSLWDIKTHLKMDDTYDVLSEVDEYTSLIEKLPENRFLNTFSHIFAGGYAAGYYSYKWAEVMSADAYKFINRDKENSDLFRKCILEVGGSANYLDQYILFRGQKPDLSAVLEINGIK